jgi:hypothetical protein
MKRYATLLNVWVVVLLLAGVAGAAQRSRSDNGGWQLLGRKQVDFKNDRDRITVARSEGRLKRLEVRVEGAPVEINNMVVTFANGEKFTPEIRHRFDEGDRVKAIDLPGDDRRIKTIDFNYRSTSRREGKATVAVYGR